MSIKLDSSYFRIRCKPSILKPFILLQKQKKNDIVKNDWQFTNFKNLFEIDNGLCKFKSKISQRMSTFIQSMQHISTVQNYQQQQKQILTMLHDLKTVLQKCQFYMIDMNCNQIFIGQQGLYSLYKQPQNLKNIVLLSQIERTTKIFQDRDKLYYKNLKNFHYVLLLQQVTIKQINKIIICLKENMFMPSNQLFNEQLNRLNIKQYDQKLTLKQNINKNLNIKQKLNKNQYYKLYYKLLIYKECSSIQGVCRYLTYIKNILLDRKSGSLSTDHQTWILIYDVCLKLYIRNKQIRQKNILQIDQILSTQYHDQQFINFLINPKNIQEYSLASLNFYFKNSNYINQQKLHPIIQTKIFNIIEKENCWKYSEDIVEYLDNQCPVQNKERIFNNLIKKINILFVSNLNFQQQKQSQSNHKNSLKMIDIQIGLSFIIQSMCKNLQITEKIFNKQNIEIILNLLKTIKQSKQENKNKIKLLHHIFTQFIIHSYQESDELTLYLQENTQLIQIIFPQLIKYFSYYNYLMPKQLYKLIFNSSTIQNIHDQIWKGLTEIYFIQNFQETIDMEIFHNQNQSKKKISDYVTEYLKIAIINSGLQERQIMKCFQKTQQPSIKDNTQKKSYLSMKAFKDNLIFNNILMMSTFFGDYLPFTDISLSFNQFYSPLVSDIKWKCSQQQTLTLLSFVCQQLPIDVLKTTYKFLKQGYNIDWNMLKQLSNKFWIQYFSTQSEDKINAILNEQSFNFLNYKILHSLKNFVLILNMINCVFDKLNGHSQKSIKQLKIMYEWGINQIKTLQAHIYPLLLQSVVNKFQNYFKSQTVEFDNIQLCCKDKNISILDLHLCQQFYVFDTFKDFNKIGYVIENNNSQIIASLLFPSFLEQQENEKSKKEQNKLVKNLFKLLVLVQNSCLEEVINDEQFNKISNLHTKQSNYFEKAIKLILQCNQLIQQTDKQNLRKKYEQNQLFKRFISHFKLLLGKIYIPKIMNLIINIQKQESFQQISSVNKNNIIQNKFNLLNNVIELINKFDPLFQDHFAQLMQIIQQNCENNKNQSNQSNIQVEKPQILLKTLETFFKCVLKNIKVRSYHIFRIIKLYLQYTNTQIQTFNKVIAYYIQKFFNIFLTKLQKDVYNTEVERLSKQLKQSPKSITKLSTPNSKRQLSFADKVLTPIRKQKISLEQLKIKKLNKSFHFQRQSNKLSPSVKKNKEKNQQNQTNCQLKRLLIHEHKLNFIESSCTLSMFINLFSRLNYGNLPSGIQKMLNKQNDKIIYLNYLIKLTEKLKNQKIQISARDIQILSVDVYGNLTCILKGKINEQIMDKVVQLAKSTLKLTLPIQTVINLPIKLINERLFNKNVIKRIQNQLTNQKQFYNLAKYIDQFQDQPLAFELSIKSHILKISPFIKSNIHICNLQYILGQNKGSVSKKIMQTNHKLIENIMGRNAAKDLIKKYQKNNIKKQKLKTTIFHSALKQINKLLIKFVKQYKQIKQLRKQQSNNQKSQQNQKISTKISNFNFIFQKIYSIFFYTPQIFSYILSKKIKIQNDEQLSFFQIMIETLNFTVVIFCQFYVISLKINSGFVGKEYLLQLFQNYGILFTHQNQQIKNLYQKISTQIPLNLLFQVNTKLNLLKRLKSNTQQSLNILRALNFTLKNSENYRFRFYKFIKIQDPVHLQLIKKIDSYIENKLLNQLNNDQRKTKHCLNFIGKIQMMDLCLQNLISNTLFDYAKVKLDQNLKDTFIKSVYSIKCFESMNKCQINTFKQLQCVQQTQQIKQEDINSQQQLFIPNENNEKINNFDYPLCYSLNNETNFSQETEQCSQIQKKQQQSYNLVVYMSQSQSLSIKQISDLKFWFSSTVQNNQINNTLLKQLQKSCQKLFGKQNFNFDYQDSTIMFLNQVNNFEQNNQIGLFNFNNQNNFNQIQQCQINQIQDTSFGQGDGIIQQQDNTQRNNLIDGLISQQQSQQILDQIIPDLINNQIIQNINNDIIQILQQDLIKEDNTEKQIQIDNQQEQTNFYTFLQNDFKIIQDHNQGIIQQSITNKQITNQQIQQQNITQHSLQYKPSIKDIQLQQQQNDYQIIKMQPISEDIIENQIKNQQSDVQVNNFIPNRQFHYTIDNFTNQSQSVLRNIQPLQSIDMQISIQDNNLPVTKQSIFTLIQQYTLNPQILKIIKLKLKKISNQQLKKIQNISIVPIKDQIQKQMKIRGIYINPNSNQFQQGSLFSISRLVNESFQIDQSKFYQINFKKIQKKSEKHKLQLISLLDHNQWISFIQIYIFKYLKAISINKNQQINNSITFLQLKDISQLLLKLILKKQNISLVLEVILSLITIKTDHQIIAYFKNNLQKNQCLFEKLNNNLIKDVGNCLLNQIVAKFIFNRIGLPLIFKGKWNSQIKKLARSQQFCIESQSNLNSDKTKGQPLLQIFLKKSIQLTYLQQKNYENKQKRQQAIQPLPFIKYLSQYLKSVSNFQLNEYPYYNIQDTIKLSSNFNQNLLNMNNQINIKNSKKATNSLTEYLLSIMKSSKNQYLYLYHQIFYLMNYLDFQTFSQFLQILIVNNKEICQKILDKQLSVIKRFKKNTTNLNNDVINNQKFAEIYWHMRKSSKCFTNQENQENQIKFFSKVISDFSSIIFTKFKQNIFKFGYGKQQIKFKQKISHLNKFVITQSNQKNLKNIKQQIFQLEKQYLIWKANKINQILKQDILPIIQRITSTLTGCLSKWELLFEELYETFGTERQQKFILFKQCSQFYKIFLSFQMLLQQDQLTMRSMSFLKTKPSLQSTKQMVTGRRRSSFKLPRISLISNLPSFKSILKKVSPKFNFFSQMIKDVQSCPQLKIHAKYSSLQSKLKLIHTKNLKGQRIIQCRRDHIWEDTLNFLDDSFPDQDIKIKITGQIGLDYGGVRRQWITLIVKSLINPQFGLFQLSANKLSFQPSKNSYLIPNHLYHFHKFGMIVGKALKQGWLLEINFTKSFLKHLLGYTLYVQDLQDIDPDTTKSLLWILNNEVNQDLGIDFTIQNEIFGKKSMIELIQNGKQVLVNDQNKKQYIKLLASYKMTEQIRQQSKAFMTGVEKVIPYEYLKIFSYKELGIYLAGMPTVDIYQMMKFTRYENFSQDDETIEWFWEVLQQYTQEEKANFLFFLTGSYKVPYGGFKQHPIAISKMAASKDYLPVAHTCFSVIDLPEYTSKLKLKNLLKKAIQQGKGFSVS